MQPRCDIPSLPFRELSWSGSGLRVSSFAVGWAWLEVELIRARRLRASAVRVICKHILNSSTICCNDVFGREPDALCDGLNSVPLWIGLPLL